MLHWIFSAFCLGGMIVTLSAIASVRLLADLIVIWREERKRCFPGGNNEESCG